MQPLFLKKKKRNRIDILPMKKKANATNNLEENDQR